MFDLCCCSGAVHRGAPTGVGGCRRVPWPGLKPARSNHDTPCHKFITWPWPAPISQKISSGAHPVDEFGCMHRDGRRQGMNFGCARGQALLEAPQFSPVAATLGQLHAGDDGNSPGPDGRQVPGCPWMTSREPNEHVRVDGCLASHGGHLLPCWPKNSQIHESAGAPTAHALFDISSVVTVAPQQTRFIDSATVAKMLATEAQLDYLAHSAQSVFSSLRDKGPLADQG